MYVNYPQLADWILINIHAESEKDMDMEGGNNFSPTNNQH